VVGCKSKLDKAKLTQGIRVALDMTTMTIMRVLPREVRRRRALERLPQLRGPSTSEDARARDG